LGVNEIYQIIAVMKPSVGISEKDRASVVKMLLPLLADEYVLGTKTRHAHWNVSGPHFSHLHRFFQEQYQLLDEQIDDVAERIRQLGSFAPATLADFAKTTRLKEHPGREYSAQEFVLELSADHESVIRQLREDVGRLGNLGDVGTEDFVIGLIRAHEKMAWMLRVSVKE